MISDQSCISKSYGDHHVLWLNRCRFSRLTGNLYFFFTLAGADKQSIWSIWIDFLSPREKCETGSFPEVLILCLRLYFSLNLSNNTRFLFCKKKRREAEPGGQWETSPRLLRTSAPPAAYHPGHCPFHIYSQSLLLHQKGYVDFSQKNPTKFK